MNILVVNWLGREKRYAVIKNNKVEKLVIEQPKQHSSVGDIYLGSVTKVVPGMNAAFVDIGNERNGYLHRDKLPAFVQSKDPEKKIKSISTFVHQGEKLLVQVEKDATGNKGPRLTGILEFNGQAVVYMPKGCYVAISKKIEGEQREKWRMFGKTVKTEEEGILFRTASMGCTEEEVFEEIQQLRLQYRDTVQIAQSMKKPGIIVQKNSFLEQVEEEIRRLGMCEVVVDDLETKKLLAKAMHKGEVHVVYHDQKENIFSAYHLEHEVEKALRRVVWLDNGSYLVFDETEALTIIDVNSGKFLGKNNADETIVRTNELAAAEIIRQIRLRDIGGMILIDFIDMKRESDREKIMRIIQDSLLEEEKTINIIGFTPLGILQLTRKKTKVSLSEELKVRCPLCEGTGRVLSPETIAFRLERELWEHRSSEYDSVLIETTPDVKEVFTGPQNTYQQHLEEMIGLKFFFSIRESDKPYYVLRQFN